MQNDLIIKKVDITSEVITVKVQVSYEFIPECLVKFGVLLHHFQGSDIPIAFEATCAFMSFKYDSLSLGSHFIELNAVNGLFKAEIEES